MSESQIFLKCSVDAEKYFLSSHQLTCHIELDIPGHEGSRSDSVPCPTREDIGEVRLVSADIEIRHGAPIR